MSKKAPSHIELNGFWPYQVTVLADQISRYTMSVVREEANLNQSQWRVLAAVVDQPGRTAAEVTAITPMDKTIVSRAVNSLIDAGHIKKTQNEKDRRRLSLETTQSGLKLYEKIASRLNERLVRSFSTETSPEHFVITLKNYSKVMHLL